MNWTPIKPGCEMPEIDREVLVTLGAPGSRGVVTAARWSDHGDWVNDNGRIDMCRWRVLAWAPLPAPWTPAEGE